MMYLVPRDVWFLAEGRKYMKIRVDIPNFHGQTAISTRAPINFFKKIGRSVFPKTDRPHSKSAEMTIIHVMAATYIGNV